MTHMTTLDGLKRKITVPACAEESDASFISVCLNPEDKITRCRSRPAGINEYQSNVRCPLADMKSMLQYAYEHNYAVGVFGPVNLEDSLGHTR